jgi:hypothetical protein
VVSRVVTDNLCTLPRGFCLCCLLLAPRLRWAFRRAPSALSVFVLLAQYSCNISSIYPGNELNVCISGGMEQLIMMNMSSDMVRKWWESENATDDRPDTHFVVGDEELLPIRERWGSMPLCHTWLPSISHAWVSRLILLHLLINVVHGFWTHRIW